MQTRPFVAQSPAASIDAALDATRPRPPTLNPTTTAPPRTVHRATYSTPTGPQHYSPANNREIAVQSPAASIAAALDTTRPRPPIVNPTTTVPPRTVHRATYTTQSAPPPQTPATHRDIAAQSPAASIAAALDAARPHLTTVDPTTTAPPRTVHRATYSTPSALPPQTPANHREIAFRVCRGR
jgi:hypothetical protein